ncbi:hypothetical protein PG988_014423 [Apiospora saccharicola]
MPPKATMAHHIVIATGASSAATESQALTRPPKLWYAQLSKEGMSASGSCDPSPLSRFTTTTNLTLASLALHAALPCIPLNEELLQEGISTHMRHQRYYKMYIQNVIVDYYHLEEGFIK